MGNKKNNNIEDILGSLDVSQRAAAPDFFYTRLVARMQARLEDGEKSLPVRADTGWRLKPVYIIGALLLVLAVNAVVFLKNQTGTSSFTSDNDETLQQSIAAEYSLNDNNSVYDLNQDK